VVDPTGGIVDVAKMSQMRQIYCLCSADVGDVPHATRILAISGMWRYRDARDDEVENSADQPRVSPRHCGTNEPLERQPQDLCASMMLFRLGKHPNGQSRWCRRAKGAGASVVTSQRKGLPIRMPVVSVTPVDGSGLIITKSVLSHREREVLTGWRCTVGGSTYGRTVQIPLCLPELRLDTKFFCSFGPMSS
jgi:hypothetical protein